MIDLLQRTGLQYLLVEKKAGGKKQPEIIKNVRPNSWYRGKKVELTREGSTKMTEGRKGALLFGQ